MPLSGANISRAVEVQEADEASLLALTRQVLALRREHPALRLGKLEQLVAEGPLLTFDRITAGERVRCFFNLASQDCAPRKSPRKADELLSVNGGSAQFMPGYSALFLTLS